MLNVFWCIGLKIKYLNEAPIYQTSKSTCILEYSYCFICPIDT